MREVLETIQSPADVRRLDRDQLEQLAEEIRSFLIEQVLVLYGGVHVKAAERLGINRNTLHNKVDAFNSKRSTAKG